MVRPVKTQKIILEDYGSYLGMEKGCFTVRGRDGNVQRFPLLENKLSEVVLGSGNSVSTGALASLGFWDVDVLFQTKRGRPIAMLKSFDDNSHVKTRIMQYEALRSDKALEIAKNVVLAKIQGSNQVLRKYGLKQLDFSFFEKIKNLELEEIEKLRRKLLQIEGSASEVYFNRIFCLFPEDTRPEGRRGFKCYDMVNNLFHLSYELLSWRVTKAVVRAKMETHLGFLHSLAFEMPSLVCDLMEIYRFLIDDFVIENCSKFTKKDAVRKYEVVSRSRVGVREFLNDVDSKRLMRGLNQYFDRMVEIPRMKYGKRQSLDTLINEEAFLLAKYLRNERKSWIPRIPTI